MYLCMCTTLVGVKSAGKILCYFMYAEGTCDFFLVCVFCPKSKKKKKQFFLFNKTNFLGGTLSSSSLDDTMFTLNGHTTI